MYVASLLVITTAYSAPNPAFDSVNNLAALYYGSATFFGSDSSTPEGAWYFATRCFSLSEVMSLRVPCVFQPSLLTT